MNPLPSGVSAMSWPLSKYGLSNNFLGRPALSVGFVSNQLQAAVLELTLNALRRIGERRRLLRAVDAREAQGAVRYKVAAT
jgi:hypothetical protein